MSNSDLEAEFAFQVKYAGLPEPIREYPAIKGRRFRYDFCWLEQKLLIEINGGTYATGAHSTGSGIARDYEKIRLAQDAGWRIYPFDGKAVKSGEAIEITKNYLEEQQCTKK